MRQRPTRTGGGRSAARRGGDPVAGAVLALLAITAVVAPAWSGEEKPAGTKNAEPAPAWKAQFDAEYRLADGENAKLVRPPFSPARGGFHRAHSHGSVAGIPGQYGFRWKGGKAERWSWSTDPGTVESALSMADIDSVDLEGPRDLFELKVPGDWIVREGADRKAVLADVQHALTEATDGRVRIEPARLEKEVVVARGRYAFKPLAEPPPRDADHVHLFTDEIDTEEGSGGGTASLNDFLRHVGETIGQKLIDDTEPRKEDVRWRNNRSREAARKSPAGRDRLLKHLADQTSLEFRVERREVDVWRLIDLKDQAGGL